MYQCIIMVYMDLGGNSYRCTFVNNASVPKLLSFTFIDLKQVFELVNKYVFSCVLPRG